MSPMTCLLFWLAVIGVGMPMMALAEESAPESRLTDPQASSKTPVSVLMSPNQEELFKAALTEQDPDQRQQFWRNFQQALTPPTAPGEQPPTNLLVLGLRVEQAPVEPHNSPEQQQEVEILFQQIEQVPDSETRNTLRERLMAREEEARKAAEAIRVQEEMDMPPVEDSSPDAPEWHLEKAP